MSMCDWIRLMRQGKEPMARNELGSPIFMICYSMIKQAAKSMCEHVGMRAWVSFSCPSSFLISIINVAAIIGHHDFELFSISCGGEGVQFVKTNIYLWKGLYLYWLSFHFMSLQGIWNYGRLHLPLHWMCTLLAAATGFQIWQCLLTTVTTSFIACWLLRHYTMFPENMAVFKRFCSLSWENAKKYNIICIIQSKIMKLPMAGFSSCFF